MEILAVHGSSQCACTHIPNIMPKDVVVCAVNVLEIPEKSVHGQWRYWLCTIAPYVHARTLSLLLLLMSCGVIIDLSLLSLSRI